MTAKKGGLSNSLIDRKVSAKYAHLWFHATGKELPGRDPLPTSLGIVRAAWQGTDGVRLLIEEEGTGETMEIYALHVLLVQPPKTKPVPPPPPTTVPGPGVSRG